tara:strand:+ start:6596 stop:7300 length:705 start_codon:yes stop_codon:yes gene_type:complete
MTTKDAVMLPVIHLAAILCDNMPARIIAGQEGAPPFLASPDEVREYWYAIATAAQNATPPAPRMGEDELAVPRYPNEEMMSAGLYHCSADMEWADLHSAWTAMFDVIAMDGGCTKELPAALRAAPSDEGREAERMAYKTGYCEGYSDASEGMVDNDAAEEGWQQYLEKLPAVVDDAQGGVREAIARVHADHGGQQPWWWNSAFDDGVDDTAAQLRASDLEAADAILDLMAGGGK